MNITDRFKEIIAKEEEDELIILLRSLTPDQKKQLSPLIKTLSQDYWKYGLVYDKTENIKGTDRQQLMILQSAMVCLNRADYEKAMGYVWFMNQDAFKKIIDWFVPAWFNDLVNDFIREDFVVWDYQWLADATERGVLQPSKELLARSIPAMIFEFDVNKKHTFCKPENLLKRPVTLQEHIWYLFEYETNLHTSDRYLFFDPKISRDTIGWKQAFIQLAKEGRLNRQRLLKESLLASNKNFNKVLSGWFIQLFTDLKPTTAELIALQKELTGVLGAPHSKPVNAALNAIKNILFESAFNTGAFLDAVPALLSSDTKAIVITTLGILEKLIQQQPQNATNMALLACNTFIHPDDSLQEKAARLITNTISPNDASLQEALAPYITTLLLSARKLLAAAIDEPANKAASPVDTNAKNETIPNKILAPIPAIASIDDLMFLASQAFDNNHPWHIATFPAALIQWQNEILPAGLNKFEPALQRALKTARSPLTAKQGYLDRSLAIFFINVCNLWHHNYGEETITLGKQLEKLKQEQPQQMSQTTASSLIAPVGHNYHLDPGGPYHFLLDLALEKLRHQDTMPLLSTPTYEPGWIDALTLTERLVLYRENKIVPHDMDLQVAISRCYLHDTAQALALAEQKLNGEYRNLLLFLFDKHSEPHPPFNLQPAWMTASLTRKEKHTWKAFASFPWYKQHISYYTGQQQWEAVGAAYEAVELNGKTKQPKKVTAYRKGLQVIRHKDTIKADSSTLAGQPLIIGDFLRFKRYGIHHNDIDRVMLLTPNNPDPLLADTLHTSLTYLQFWDEDDRKFAISMAQALHSIWEGAGNMAHVFLATCMLHAEKTLANLAAEIWINGVTHNNINSTAIGQAIGIMESIELAPLKRFTGLALQQLIRISDKHNQKLQIIIEQVLEQLPEQPVTNLKKLLEVYAELLAMNKTNVTNQQVINKLGSWKRTKTIKKIVEDLLANSIKE